MIDVRAIWTSVKEKPRSVRYSLELAERYMSVAKLETVVRDVTGPVVAAVAAPTRRYTLAA